LPPAATLAHAEAHSLLEGQPASQQIEGPGGAVQRLPVAPRETHPIADPRSGGIDEAAGANFELCARELIARLDGQDRVVQACKPRGTDIVHRARTGAPSCGDDAEEQPLRIRANGVEPGGRSVAARRARAGENR